MTGGFHTAVLYLRHISVPACTLFLCRSIRRCAIFLYHSISLIITTVATMTAWILAMLLDLTPLPFQPLKFALWQWISLRLLASFCGVFGFSIMFNSPVQIAVAAGIVGAVTNTLRLELVDLLPFAPAVAAFIGAFLSGMFASAASWLVSALLIILALPLGLIFARIITDKTFRYCT